MRAIYAVMIILAGSVAHATDGARVWTSDPNKVDLPKLTPWEAQVSGCWNISVEVATGPAVDLDVTLDADGNVVSVAEVKPAANDAETEVADSGVKAIWKCSPYKDQGSKTLRFRMDPQAMF